MKDRILMITSEAVPFAKSGGLADMVSALSIALKNEGSDVRILMPLYGFIDTSGLDLISENYSIPFPNRIERASLYAGVLPETRVPVYFLRSDKYFNRTGIYGPTPASAYPDNGIRYSFFSRAALYLPPELNWVPQIYHSHDWPTGLNPLYIKLSDQEEISQKTSVFTIHNMGYQGEFSQRDIPWTGLTKQEMEQSRILVQGRLNFLKSGIENCHIISTVSPTYASEIQTEDYGHGLDNSLSERKDSLVGIVNGVDYSMWDPAVDSYISPDNFTVSSLKNKELVKHRLQKEFSLEESTETAVFAMISRLVEQKGIFELCDPQNGILKGFCQNNPVQVVILGTGEEWCENELQKLSGELPNLSVKITYNDRISHLMEAGADFFMMPSRYEPCGLNQLYSLKYGTLPVVRKTGGLADTVQDISEGLKDGTGFLYEEASSSALLKALERASRLWQEEKPVIDAMRKNAMKQDFSWGPSAREYLKIYKKAREST